MVITPFKPMFSLTRGKTVESIHFGAMVAVDVFGNILASYGDPQTLTFLRSSAKPFQALPLIENNGQSIYGFTQREIAITCASHSGTDEHVSVIRSMQAKIGVSESDLLCGVHFPLHEPTANELRARRELPTPNQHNCSGKHTGMLAYARLVDPEKSDLPYIDPMHPIQRSILLTFADFCGLQPEEVHSGVDGCSAPNFAVPLYHSALAYARLCDPQTAKVMPSGRQKACQVITTAMWSHPDMVGGPGRFDTGLMSIGAGRFIAKGGAEGYQNIGVFPGVLSPQSPAIGIALKISDGDSRGKIVPAVSLEILRQLGILSTQDLTALSNFGPNFPVYNWRKILVGQGDPMFDIQRIIQEPI